MTRVIDWGVAGAWTAATIDIILIGVICFGRFVRERWRNINIFAGTGDQPPPMLHPEP